MLGEVLWVDRFGNCQLNVGPDELDGRRGHADGVVADRRSTTSSGRRASPPTFAELPAGAVGLVLDCQGMFALALDQRSAASELRLAQGDAVAAQYGRRSATSRRRRADAAPVELRRVSVACDAVRPATTLTIGLLLAADPGRRHHLADAALSGTPAVPAWRPTRVTWPSVAGDEDGIGTRTERSRGESGADHRRPRPATTSRSSAGTESTTYGELSELVARARGGLVGQRHRRRRPGRVASAATDCRSSSPTSPSSASARSPCRSTRPARRPSSSASSPRSRRWPPSSTAAPRSRGATSTGRVPSLRVRRRRRRRRDPRRHRGDRELLAVRAARRSSTSTPDHLARADVHERHGRRARGGDAHATAACTPTSSRSAATNDRVRSDDVRLRRHPAVPHLTGSTSCSAWRCARAPRSCSSSASIRPRRSSTFRERGRHRRARRAGDVGGVQPLRRGARRRVRRRPARLVRRGEAAGDASPSGSSERFGLVVAEGYGLTEASPVVTSSTGLDPKHGSVGRVLDGIEMRIVDEDGDDALVGDAGRDLGAAAPTCSPATSTIPRRRPGCSPPTGGCAPATSATATTTAALYLVDRAKDLVIVSGFNVFPAEVEEVLLEHPGVAEVGVVGVPHPHTGEAVKAFVVPEPGSDARRGGARSTSPATTSPATSARARSSSSTSCRATPPASSLRRELDVAARRRCTTRDADGASRDVRPST